eukprot:gene11597-12649_t
MADKASTTTTTTTAPTPAADAGSSSSSSVSIDPQSLVGMKVDFEMKVLVIVTVFAFFKILKFLADNIHFINLCRGFFIFGHIYFIYLFMDTNYRISKSSSRTAEEKDAGKKACFDILKGMLVKACIMFIVHLKAGILPPLFVTVILGFCALIENNYYYQVLYTKFPAVFEFLYR